MKREKQEKAISDELIDELLKQGRRADDVNGLLKQLCWKERYRVR